MPLDVRRPPESPSVNDPLMERASAAPLFLRLTKPEQVARRIACRTLVLVYSCPRVRPTGQIMQQVRRSIAAYTLILSACASAISSARSTGRARQSSGMTRFLRPATRRWRAPRPSCQPRRDPPGTRRVATPCDRRRRDRTTKSTACGSARCWSTNRMRRSRCSVQYFSDLEQPRSRRRRKEVQTATAGLTDSINKRSALRSRTTGSESRLERTSARRRRLRAWSRARCTGRRHRIRARC